MKIKISDREDGYGTRILINLDNGKAVSLPHGSGINGSWVIEEKRGKYYCYNGYDTMDDAGYYDMWIDFYLVIPKNHAEDWDLRFTTSPHGYYRIRKYALREYLEHVFVDMFLDLGDENEL